MILRPRRLAAATQQAGAAITPQRTPFKCRVGSGQGSDTERNAGISRRRFAFDFIIEDVQWVPAYNRWPALNLRSRRYEGQVGL
jgi:hypothetical protein